MASLSAFPPPHSCDFCQKLVLYCKDRRWWGEALESPAGAEGLLSTRARDWMLEEMGDWWKKSFRKRKREILESLADLSFRKRKREILESLADFAVFDCTMGEARLAAKAGCKFCLGITNKDRHAQIADENKSDAGSFLAGMPSLGVFGVLSWSENKWRCENDPGCSAVTDQVNRFEILALSDSIFPKEIATRPINVTPSSEDSFHQVQGWLETCLKTHQECPAPTGKFMPTRVLEIVQRPGQSRSHIRLRETSSLEPAPYAALSYCWGGPQPITTTSASYPRHSLIINKQSVPPSVRDAVLLTEKIGIKYLWIDAFCIIQDDETDKNWEIVQMPLIYSQATVTIVASRAKGVTEGFLHERPKMGEETPDHIFELPFRCSDNNLGAVVLLPRIQPPTEPLDLRAWALQERFLSPRIVDYGSLQTRWICQASDLEGCIDGFKNMSVFCNERDDNLFTLALQNILDTSETVISDDRRQDLLQQWGNMLKIYTHRTLTLGTDRLPGISGIAAQFGRVLCDEYKAGLWKSAMISQLCWIRSEWDRGKLKSRPLDYQGPSWSWAAINEPIFAPTYRNYTKHVDLEIVDCEIVIKNGAASFSVYDPSFSAVEAASLKVKGRLGKAVCEYDSESDDKVMLKKGGATQPQDILHAGVNLDALEEEFTDGHARFIPIFLLMVLVGPRPTGLILRHLQGAEFSRLGVFEFDDTAGGNREKRLSIVNQIEWLNSAPVQTITII